MFAALHYTWTIHADPHLKGTCSLDMAGTTDKVKEVHFLQKPYASPLFQLRFVSNVEFTLYFSLDLSTFIFIPDFMTVLVQQKSS